MNIRKIRLGGVLKYVKYQKSPPGSSRKSKEVGRERKVLPHGRRSKGAVPESNRGVRAVRLTGWYLSSTWQDRRFCRKFNHNKLQHPCGLREHAIYLWRIRTRYDVKRWWSMLLVHLPCHRRGSRSSKNGFLWILQRNLQSRRLFSGDPSLGGGLYG